MNEIINLKKENNDTASISPKLFDDFIGQKSIIQNLKTYIEASRLRKEALDHVLFSGPPGLGKTTLSCIISSLQQGQLYQVAAPNLKRPGDIAKILTNLEKFDVLFIDEIHRLPAVVEETLYSAMQDKFIDITMNEGLASSVIKIDLPPFTMIGATTKPGMLTGPLRDRFGIQLRLNYYSLEELSQIIERCRRIWEFQLDKNSIIEISKRSRSTPRIAIHLLRRIWDYLLVYDKISTQKKITQKELVEEAFSKMRIDSKGLTSLDIEFLMIMAKNYQGGPVGLKAIAAILSEDIITIEDFIEPYLVKINLVQRTPQGRILTKEGFSHLNMQIPASYLKKQEPSLFVEVKNNDSIQ